MHVLDPCNAGVRHGLDHGGGGGLDLSAASDLVRQEIPRRRDADGEPLAAKAVVRGGDGRSAAIAGAAPVGRHLGKHRGVRAQHALGAAGDHHGYALLDLCIRGAQIGRERRGKRGAGVFVGKVVDAAIAFGLHQERRNVHGIEYPVLDQGSEPRHIGGPRHRDAEGIGAIGYFVHCRCLPACSTQARPSSGTLISVRRIPGDRTWQCRSAPRLRWPGTCRSFEMGR